MSNEVVVIASEGNSPGTWATPSIAIPVTKAAHKLGRQYIQQRYTGRGRGVAKALLGGIMPNGSLEMDLWPEHMGLLVAAAGFSATTTTPGGATNARLHGFEVQEASTFENTLSMQIQHSSAIGFNVLQALINKLTITASGGAQVTVAADYIAKDEAHADGTTHWNYDGSTDSPDIISSPTQLGAALTPYLFYEAALVYGGTAAQDGSTKQITMGTPTSISTVTNLEISIDNGAEQVHTVTDDPTPNVIASGDLSIECKLDLDQSTLSKTFYEYFRDGNDVGLQLTLTGAEIESGQDYMFQVTVPSLKFNEADFHDAEGQSGRRSQAITAVGVLNSVVDAYIGIAIKDTQTGY